MKHSAIAGRGRRLGFTLFLMLMIAVGPSHGAEPPTDPVLRIDPGMHTAMIGRIASDAAGTLLATASNDKTLRIWDPASGQLRRTLRVPAAPGKEGMLYAAAVSPDGRTAAAGGWTGYAWEKTNCIYLFDLSNSGGGITHRITGLPQVILHLAFSKDGRYLAATLAAGGGLRVYRTADRSLAASDPAYDGHAYWADFDAEGRLVTACYDGHIRLYDPAFNLKQKVRTASGNRPYSAAFSPDGRRIAVGYADRPAVDVLSGRDLDRLFSPPADGAVRGTFSTVAWSTDGTHLFGGGQYRRGRRCALRRWSAPWGPRAKFTDLEASGDSILQVLPLPDGRTAFCAADPAWGIFDRSGRRTLYTASAMADFRGQGDDTFSVSSDGAAVRFSLGYGGQQPVLFSATDRTLQPAPGPVPGMTAPRSSAPGLSSSNWKNSPSPRLNDRPLELDPYETARCASATPDGRRFLLGTEWFLRCYDRTGTLLWKVPMGGAVWAAAVSGDGRMAVAAVQDGTIRWRRMSDGKALMALFPHADGKRWILWTPSGRYAASAGADALIGWRVNRGADQEPDFFPAAKFRSAYYRPDALVQVLRTLDPAAGAGGTEPPAPVARMLPPVVVIRSPVDETLFDKPDIVVTYEIRNPSGAPIKDVKVLVDGRPPVKERGIRRTPRGKVGEMRVPLPSRDCEISLVAENQYAAGNPATVRLRWEGKKQTAPKPRLFVLAVGVSAYDRPDLRLGFPAQDARDLAAVFKQQKDGFYRAVDLRVVVDESATRQGILDGLDWIRQQTSQEDVAVIFLAGHGVNGPDGAYYFLPRNADPERLAETGAPYAAIRDVIVNLPGKALAFVDTCHSGNIMGGGGAGDVDQVANDLSAAENGVVVFASSTGRQVSVEHPRWGNGAFTEALVEALSGKADYTNDRTITINELDLYIAERVASLTGGRQTPTTTKPRTVPNFPVAAR